MPNRNTAAANSPEPMYHQIISTYLDNRSVTDTAAKCKTSAVKVRKVLITEGLWSSRTSIEVQHYLNLGKTTAQIAAILCTTEKAVQQYLPYTRGLYGGENPSVSAVNSARYRERIRIAKANVLKKTRSLAEENHWSDILESLSKREGSTMLEITNDQFDNDYLRLHLELFDSDGSPVDAETTSVLQKFGGVQYGKTITRDILVSKDMPLWALNYAIQRCFGWQNSHLHRFCLPDAQFRALADNNTKNYARLVGVVFRSPWMDEEEQFWADDYEDGSFKTWLKRKYTAPYKSLCYGESLYQCEHDVAELEQRYAYCRVQRTRYDDGPDFFGDPEAISRAEYLRLKAKAPLKTKKTTKYGHSEVSYQEVHKFAEIPFDSIRWFGESVQAGSLLERLPIGEVLHPLCDCTKASVKPPMQFSEFMTAEQCDEVARCTGSDSPVAQPHVHPFTDTLYYNYDFGDDWHVQITASQNADDLIESKRLASEELEEAVLQLHSKRRPVCIAQDGLPVFDDVGNIHGYAAFLKCISRDIRKKVYAVDDIEEDEDSSPYPYQDKQEVLEWAKSLGWSKRKVSNKNLL